MNDDELNSIEIGRFLDISNDYAFKLIFGKEENKHLLKSLINSFISDREIKDITFKDREMQGLTPNNKYVRFDLHCTDENGEEFLVEIQKGSIKHFYSRVLYYGSLLYASTAKVGDEYYEDLKPVYVISLIFSPLKEPEFKELTEFVLWYQMCEKTHHYFAPNGINIIFANVYRAADNVANCKTESEKWCQIIRDMSKYSCEPSEVGGGHWEELATLSQSCLYEKETIVNYKKSLMDAKYNRTLIKESFEDGFEEGMLKGEAKGRAEGEAKGRAEGKVEVAKALLENGVAINIVSQSTGFSIQQLQTMI